VRELPQVGVPLGGEELALGRAMGLPVVWRRPGARLDGTGLIGAWRGAGRKALHVVAGRGITLDTGHSNTTARGLNRLLAHLGLMKAAGPPETVADVTRGEVESHRAAHGGVFVPEVRVGDRVSPGHLLGHLQSPIGGDRLDEVRAQRKGVVMTVRAWPMVHAQELLVRVAGTPDRKG
jgi:Predicted deacylase